MNDHNQLLVGSCWIRYRQFGSPGDPRLILLHGGAAHSGWWIEAASQLALNFRTLVPDLSGFGASGHRESYSPELWADEVAALVEHTGGPSVGVVGHSMGGRVGIYAAARYPDLIHALILVDSPARWPQRAPDSTSSNQHPRRFYTTQESALSRFRLRPPETTADPALLMRLAHQSMTSVDGKWTWRHDPAAMRRFTDEGVDQQLGRVRCPVGFVYGQRSTIAGPATVDYLRQRLRQPVPAVEIPAAYHHVPLDAPQECAAAVSHLMAELMPRPPQPIQHRPTMSDSDRQAG